MAEGRSGTRRALRRGHHHQRALHGLRALRAHGPGRRRGDEGTRIDRRLRRMDVVTTDTCINYQTVYQPHLGEHVAWGDTGTVIYANSVFGARSNFEAGPAALAAALTGRTPEYGFHLDEHRKGSFAVELKAKLDDLADWGAVGKLVGESHQNYYAVPVFHGYHRTPDRATSSSTSAPRWRATARWACSISSASRPRRRRSSGAGGSCQRRGWLSPMLTSSGLRELQSGRRRRAAGRVLRPAAIAVRNEASGRSVRRQEDQARHRAASSPPTPRSSRSRATWATRRRWKTRA